jgi:hypothetical protein
MKPLLFLVLEIESLAGLTSLSPSKLCQGELLQRYCGSRIFFVECFVCSLVVQGNWTTVIRPGISSGKEMSFYPPPSAPAA